MGAPTLCLGDLLKLIAHWGGAFVAFALTSTVTLAAAPAHASPVPSNPGADPSDSAAVPVDSTPEPSVEIPSASPTPPTQPLSQAPSEAADDQPLGDTVRSTGGFTTQILAPAVGANVPAGAISYIVQVATAGAYWLDLSCGGEFVTDEYLSASYESQQFSGTIGSPGEGESCSLSLYPIGSGATGEDYVSFTVAAAVPSIRNATAKADKFYPKVRDGYRDRTEIVFGARGDSDVTVDIVSSASGATVRSFARRGHDWADYYSRRSVSWNGANDSGRGVPTGRYVAVIRSALGEQIATARVPLRLASGHRTSRVTERRAGWYGSRDRTSGDCFAWEHTAGNWLNCWGSGYAQATYLFRIPSNARDINWRVDGFRQCCASPGRIIRTGNRPKASLFRVTVKVTGWRSFVVRRASVTYTYRRAI